ncbi:MAG TPA: helix-turn-helix transcriptional regulator [Terriglobales bacterium]
MLSEADEKRGYSQESFANCAGYYRNYVGQLEQSEKSPSLKAIFDFAKALQLRPSALVKLVAK